MQNSFYLDGEDIARIFEMVERNCPILMKTGGGMLRKEQLSSGKRVPPEDVALFRKLKAEGLSGHEIARRTGWTQFTIAKYLRRSESLRSN